mgnify:FL=1
MQIYILIFKQVIPGPIFLALLANGLVFRHFTPKLTPIHIRIIMKMTQYRLRCLLGAVLLGLFSLSLSASPQENEIILPELPSGLFASHDEISWAESVLEDFRDEVGTETSFIADDDQAELPYDQAMEAWSAMNSVLRDLQSSVDQCVNPEACNWPMIRSCL